MFASHGMGKAGRLLVWEIPPPSRPRLPPPWLQTFTHRIYPEHQCHPSPGRLFQSHRRVPRRGVCLGTGLSLCFALGLSFPPPLQPTPCLGSVCAAGRVLTCSESERARDFILDILVCSTRPQHSVLFLHPDPDPVLPVPPRCVGAGTGFGVGCGRCCCPALLSSVWFGYKGSVKNLLKLSPSKWFLEQQFWLLDSSELTKQSVGKKSA